MLKTTLKISTAVALLTVVSMAGNGHQHQRGQSSSANNQQNTNVPSTPRLSDAQKEGLIFMAEEEKVARDVYSYLSEKWGARVFSNITASEQKHMDSVENLLNTYQLPVPSTMDEEGIFIDEKLQAMYDDLIAKGDKSLEDAYEVGVEIEETDIDDLHALLEKRMPSDVEDVYNNLLDGSYNHLRSFNRQLDK